MTDILAICDQIDAAGEWRDRHGYTASEFEEEFCDDECVYLALAANHAQTLTAVVRRLVEVVRAIPDDDQPWSLAELYIGLRADYPGLLASPPEAGRLEGGEEKEDASH